MTMMAVLMLCCASCMMKPSGNIVKKEYKMKAFDKLDIDLVAHVKFVQSTDGDYRVRLKCPENYVDLYNFKVKEGELELAYAKNMQKGIEAKDVNIIVYSPTLRQIDSEGIGNITIDSLNTPSLHIDSEGVSNISIKDLTTEVLIVESSGVGNIELKGKAPKVSFTSSGVGNIIASELTAEDVKADISGVGNITCFASRRIQGNLDGVGSLKYGGHPEQKHLQRNGIGKISEM